MQIKRIIPCLDIYKGRVVKGVNFENLKDAGDPVEIAKKYNDMKADEIVFLDISASLENRRTMLDVMKRAAKEVTIPLTVGGGIRNIDDIRDILNAGVDKISINSSAVKTPDLIKEASIRFGSQRIVVAIDAKKSQDGVFEVFINGGKVNTGLDAVEWAKTCESLGAGEILLTSMDKDGVKSGYDLELTRKVSEAVNIPVIASGGAGKKEDFYDVLSDKGKASAALAASLFHFNELEIGKLKQYLKSKGISVRI
ncbi:MAG: imidazole glycerol phosphate synthase subunit HisF [Bacillota bacterium]|jgi:cyclase|nr:imidazole glycerol phosphate synthase subunit HisF [Bacillota bacterium]HHU43622.1 imidazole glycerol phosphate synthase subunit HisF [Clostridiales bacterium]